MFRSLVRNAFNRVRNCGPRLEKLESRLQPGETLFGLFWGVALIDGDIPTFGRASLETGGSTNESREWRKEMLSPESMPVDEHSNYSEKDLIGATEKSQHGRHVAEPLAMSEHVVPPAFRRPWLEANSNRVRSADAASTLLRAPHSGFIRSAASLSKPASPLANTLGTTSSENTENAIAEVGEQLGRLPLSFEDNQGQFDSRVDFVARGPGYATFLTPTEAAFVIQNSASRIQNSESEGPLSAPRPLGSGLGAAPLADARGSESSVVRMQIVGANPTGRATGINPLEGKVNYFLGDHPSQWHTNIPTYGQVEYHDVYPGIDLVYYGKDDQLEYDFIVSPGSAPDAIKLNFSGAEGAEINPQGDLVLHTSGGDIVHQKPFTYQEVGNTRQEVASQYVMDAQQVRFDVGAYDATRPLVIDPVVMAYSTYLGSPSAGKDDIGWDIAVDTAGNAYVTGETTAVDFLTTPGAFDTTHNGLADVFVTKLNSTGTGLVYSTYFGGSDFDVGRGIAVDGNGNAYITGNTRSSNFPTTPGAFDATVNNTDVFVTKLNPGGSALAYSTFLGGSGSDVGYAIALDGAGNAFVCGYTQSEDFPTTPGAFDTTWNFIQDAFVTKLDSDGAALAYSTFLGGGSGDEYAYAIAVNGAGEAYVTGYTSSFFFPTTPGAFDTSSNGNNAFVTKFNTSGSALAYSTFLGANDGGFSSGEGIVVDSEGNAYVAGLTSSISFPVTVGPVHGGGHDAFVTKFNGSGSALVYSRFLGGTPRISAATSLLTVPAAPTLPARRYRRTSRPHPMPLTRPLTAPSRTLTAAS